MAFKKNIFVASKAELKTDAAVVQACDDYGQYLRLILEPAMEQLRDGMEARNLRLHQVFGANLYLAHAVDYIQKIRRTADISETRSEFMTQFDRLFSVKGARFGNKKFELIDAINNALKHIRLDPVRYKQLEERYGLISFQSLVEEGGDVLCLLEGYRFDYVRVVLRPAWHALKGWDFESVKDVLEFACEAAGQWASGEQFSGEDWDDPIDKMMEACNPTCEDCGEQENECRCSQYVYQGAEGEFVSAFRRNFDFDEVMSRISGAYRRERD